MALYFLDSSALVKRYVREAGTAWVSGFFPPLPSRRVAIAAISSVEVIAAISRRVRTGSISPTDASSGIKSLRSDLLSDFEVVEVTASLINQAMDFAEQHQLRGYDAVQLAAAIEARAVARLAGAALMFVSADLELNSAAAAEGFVVDDPNNHP